MNPTNSTPVFPPLPDASPLRHWLAGGTTLAGASLAASGALAGTVQIDLLNNSYTNGAGGNQLYLDLTGDGIDDLPGLRGDEAILSTASVYMNYTAIRVRVFAGSTNFGVAQFKTGVRPGSVPFKQFIAGRALAGTSLGDPAFKSASITNGSVNAFPDLQEYFSLIPVTFTDSRINGGAPTNGYVETRSYNILSDLHAVELVRLVFDDTSTVRPTGVVKMGTNKRWVDPAPARLAKITALRSKIAALERKLKVYKKLGKKTKIVAANRSIRALRAQLARV